MGIRLVMQYTVDEKEGDYVTIFMPQGGTVRGFGTFLENLQADEIDCDTASKQVLQNAATRKGLFGCEFWSNNIFSIGCPEPITAMPISEFNRTNGSDEYLWIDAIVPNDDVSVQTHINAYLAEHANESS